MRAAQVPEMSKWIQAQSFDMKVLPSEPAHAAMLSELAGWKERAKELADLKIE